MLCSNFGQIRFQIFLEAFRSMLAQQMVEIFFFYNTVCTRRYFYFHMPSPAVFEPVYRKWFISDLFWIILVIKNSILSVLKMPVLKILIYWFIPWCSQFYKFLCDADNLKFSIDNLELCPQNPRWDLLFMLGISIRNEMPGCGWLVLHAKVVILDFNQYPGMCGNGNSRNFLFSSQNHGNSE